MNARVAGPRLGKGVQQVIQAARSGDWTESDGEVVAGGVPLVAGEYELVLEVAGDRADQALALLPGGGFLLLDTALTPSSRPRASRATSCGTCRTRGRARGST
ncbi:Isoleucine--tRNA ligase [Clavibacter michiganensis subsp. michiganensis]|uniref:Isoleucine--tRNA ligase n=1 Tax=Clavibacter michiganensis subsp. michiganensis TaxID=33013 RepID=A0A251XEZ9_CLAMM|nr:Isoleucine--tRNA ligase [Clavibacter michiganensis subsp. michiganensis]OUE00667.1 Isoleucine--tRNA ligase [Clavibacter michiganensis subsp. michiganensis]